MKWNFSSCLRAGINRHLASLTYFQLDFSGRAAQWDNVSTLDRKAANSNPTDALD